MMKQYFIIDFDSTFITSESLEELAAIVLKSNPEREKILKQMKEITDQGMNGTLPFNESLRKRLQLIKATKSDIELLIKVLKRQISPSIARNKKFFKEFKDQIYIISGGFTDFVYPIVAAFGISQDHVLANKFIFDTNSIVVGFDTQNPLSHNNGKVDAVKQLNLQGEIYVIGDGYTDYQIKQLGLAKRFIAFTENIEREPVINKADYIAASFDEFLYVNKLPMTISYPKNRIKVLLLENIHQQAVRLFEKEGYTVEYHQKTFDEKELAERMKDVHIVGIRSRTKITPAVIKQAQRLMAVGAFCIGTDQIDLKATAAQGVVAFNAPYSNTRSVVELALGEIIMLSRQTFLKNAKLHAGEWDKSAVGSHEIRGKKLGIIGYGNIGSQLSVVAEALGMEVYFYDIAEKLALGNAIRCKTMSELLKKADIITVHVDGRNSNNGLIGIKEFKQMKNGAIFLNLSRGKIVDIDALATFIKNKKIVGAGVDVFPQEPKGKGDQFMSPLQNLPNVILTPHVGGSTEEAQENIAQFVSTKIIEYINTGNTDMSVNIPNLQSVPLKNAHRLLHMHNNVPGVLAKINDVLAQYKINIVGQSLKTNDQIGYVITDVNKKYDKKVIQALKTIEDTIRFRTLY